MFDFLFSNPIIIIILIGVISSLLKKKNKGSQPKSGQPQAPKPIWKEVIREFQEEWLEEKKKIPKTIQEAKDIQLPDSKQKDEAAERKRVAELKRLQQEYEEKHHQEVEPEMSTPTVFPMPASAKVIPLATMNTISDKRSPIYNKEISFGKQELIDGIIMSEVLGPPKSKRRLK